MIICNTRPTNIIVHVQERLLALSESASSLSISIIKPPAPAIPDDASYGNCVGAVCCLSATLLGVQMCLASVRMMAARRLYP